MNDFFEMAKKELERGRKLHGDIHSSHEGLGILEEEFWEFKLEVFKKVIDKKAMLEELSQIAAMCGKIAEDICMK